MGYFVALTGMGWASSTSPLYAPSEDGDKVKDMLQGICWRLQDVLSKAPEENEEITQVICKKFWKRFAGISQICVHWSQMTFQSLSSH